MRRIGATDRLAIAALAVADVGVGVLLCTIGTLPGMPVVHTIVGVVALVLALPAIAAVAMGALTDLADEGVLVNVAVLTFTIGEVLSLPGSLGQRVGIGLVLLAATGATVGLYLRLFGVLRLRRRDPAGQVTQP